MATRTGVRSPHGSPGAAQTSRPPSLPDLFLSEDEDEAYAVDALAEGGVIGFGFGNIYALAARPELDAVRRANLRKGRPPDQVGSVVTTPIRIPMVFDWSRLPAGLGRRAVLDLMDALFAAGPFGFRGPAVGTVPGHLTHEDAGLRTTQVIAPGYSCPSNRLIGACLRRTGGDVLHITSANRSHHSSGAAEEPAHYQGNDLVAEFGDGPGLAVLRHRDEAVARGRYPLHAPMSTTVLALHRTAGVDEHDRVGLVVERHGSLPVDELRRVVEPLGFFLVLAPGATTRLPQRTYPA